MLHLSTLGKFVLTRDSFEECDSAAGEVQIKITCPQCGASFVGDGGEVLWWRSEHQCVRSKQNSKIIRFPIQPVR
jgi:hypothetical protein